MYESHFGLTDRPFRDANGASEYVPTASRESARLRLRYGLEHSECPCVLVGPSGTGRTLLGRVIADDLSGPTAFLTFPAMPPEELVPFLADEFAGRSSLLIPGRENLSAALRRFRGWLADRVAHGPTPLLVVDDAHLIRDERTFETLRLLMDLSRSRGPSDLRLLLVGHPELLDQLPESIQERLAAQVEIGPWLKDETAAYLEGRIARAGGPSGLFPAEAVSLIHRLAFGMPRRVNRLADLSLLVACANGQNRPDVESVEVASREIGGNAMAA